MALPKNYTYKIVGVTFEIALSYDGAVFLLIFGGIMYRPCQKKSLKTQF